jgi:hypothetical protein
MYLDRTFLDRTSCDGNQSIHDHFARQQGPLTDEVMTWGQSIFEEESRLLWLST